MFGLRLVRKADHDRLIAAYDEERRANVALRERLIETTAQAQARAMTADWLTVRTNQLEAENAGLRHKLTGTPQIAPQIGKGRPIDAANLGVGADLYEDPGDQQAERMAAAGLLHEDAIVAPLPSAAALTADLDQDGASHD